MKLLDKVKNIFHKQIVEEENEEFIDEHYLQAVEDLKERIKERRERLEVLKKRRIYFQYFKIRERYGISFKTFNYKVDQGTWYPWLAD